MHQSQRRWTPHRLPLLLLLIMGGALLWAFDPAGSRLFPPCPSRLATGFHCPGCGSLRAMHRLLHGNVPGAMSMNPLMVLSLPLLVLLSLRPRWAYRPWLPWLLFLVLIAFTILRNIDAWPLTTLAPSPPR